MASDLQNQITLKLRPVLIFLSSAILAFSTIIFGQEDMKLISLLPIPHSITQKDERFRLTADFTVAVNGKFHERLYISTTRMLRRLSGRTGLFFGQDFITKENPGNKDEANFLINVKRPGKVKLYENNSCCSAMPTLVTVVGFVTLLIIYM